MYINLEETSDQSNEKMMNNLSNSILTQRNQPKFEVVDGIRSTKLQVYEFKCVKCEIFLFVLSMFERRDRETEMYLPESISK